MTLVARPTLRRALGLAAVPLLVLAACGGDDGPAAAPPTSSPATTAAHPHPELTGTETLEVPRPAPRLAVAHDGGVLVLDAATLEPLGDVELPGVAALQAAGDARHLVATTEAGFQLLDSGAWTEFAGDHAHHYTAPPALTEVVRAAEAPGRVVANDGLTALFDDGTGAVEVVLSSEVAAADASVRALPASAPHQGVAVPLAGGLVVVSEGDGSARTGVRVLDLAGEEAAPTEACPGAGGVAVAEGSAVVVGCGDGVVVHRDGVLTTVAAPAAAGPMGELAGSPASPVVLGGLGPDPQTGPAGPTRVGLVDTGTAELAVVDLPSSYSSGALGRGPDGEALVLGTDGSLHVVDPATAAVTRSVPIIAPWEAPADPQAPRPALHVLGQVAYVSEPTTRALHVVDLDSWSTTASTTLDVVPVRLLAVSGDLPDAERRRG